jgi:DNA polymerase-3 subunit epsilon
MKAIVLDTETTGLVNFKQPPEHDTQPDLVQLAAMLCEPKEGGGFIKRASLDFIVVPSKPVSDGAAKAHGIGPQTIKDYGVAPDVALRAFQSLLQQADVIVAFNLAFDAAVLRTAWHRAFGEDIRKHLDGKMAFCAMKAATPVCKVLHSRARHAKDYKWPTLSEAIEFFFAERLEGAHDALVDTNACARVYFELLARKGK